MEEFCSGMPPSHSQLKPESTASLTAAAGGRGLSGEQAGILAPFPPCGGRSFQGNWWVILSPFLPDLWSSVPMRYNTTKNATMIYFPHHPPIVGKF
jgi:hypothetical protein